MKTNSKITFVLGLLLLIPGLYSFSQVGINTDNSAPDNSAILDLKSTDKGLLIPRMTQSQIGTISNPANGLLVFCTTDGKMYIYVTTLGNWKEVAYGAGTISPPLFVCGSSITISHVAGAVAPVDKTVTYGTVTNIPGETSKCWITSNLGADHQATAVDDATEASAGWYWQFNLKQGYKHDGSTRTPNTTWIGSISENSDWTTANDPCTIELGTGWRIPTFTEWTNVKTSGNWTDGNGPWNSDLKMHDAGYLEYNDGSLYLRGVYGLYWSSTQTNTDDGWYLSFYGGYINVDTNTKARAFSLRCLRD